MTVKEKIMDIVHTNNDLEADSLEKLIYIAYYMGREAATREVSDRYNNILAAQRKRADECRYFNMAHDIIGSAHYVYSSDYAMDITTTFGSDATEL